MTSHIHLPDLTLETLVQHYPGLAKILALEGAKQERERSQGVEAQLLPGFEALIQELK